MLPLGVTLGFKWAESLSPTFQIAGRPVGPWRLLGLLLAFLLRGVALPHQRVQSHYSTKSLAPCALRPLHLGFWHLLHIWSARWGGCCLIVNLKNFHKSLLLLLFKVEPGVSGQLYALLGHQWVPFYLCFLYGNSCISTTFSRDKVVLVDEFLGFNIYLHDKGQFWPGLEMGELILHSFPFLRLQLRSSGIKLCQVLAKGHRVGRKLWGHLKENRSDMVAKTFAQVRKKTLLNKEDIACSEVIPSFWPIFNPGPQLLVPILRSQLGRQRGRMPLRLVQVSIYEQFDFFKNIFQQLAHQWGWSLLPDRGCNQLSKCLVKGSAGESSSTPSPPV